MINNAKWVLNDGVAISYETDDGEGKILFSDILPYWNHATEDEFETGKIYTDDDNNALWILWLVASGQGGVVIGWDVGVNKLIHISEASYAVALDTYEGDLYTLHVISNYTSKPQMGLFKTQIGTIDAQKETTKVESFSIDKADEYNGNPDDVDVIVDETGVKVAFGDEVFC